MLFCTYFTVTRILHIKYTHQQVICQQNHFHLRSLYEAPGSSSFNRESVFSQESHFGERNVHVCVSPHCLLKQPQYQCTRVQVLLKLPDFKDSSVIVEPPPTLKYLLFPIVCRSVPPSNRKSFHTHL